MTDETQETHLLDLENPPTGGTPSQRLPHRISLSHIDINVDDIHRSLNAVNTFAMKRMDKAQSVLMYEITVDGEGVYKSMTLRELLYYINDEADEIDSDYFENESSLSPVPPQHPVKTHVPPVNDLSPASSSASTTSIRPERTSLASKLFANEPTETEEVGRGSNRLEEVVDLSHSSPRTQEDPDRTERELVTHSTFPMKHAPQSSVSAGIKGTTATGRNRSNEESPPPLLIDYASELPSTDYHSDSEAILTNYRNRHQPKATKPAPPSHPPPPTAKDPHYSHSLPTLEDPRRSFIRPGRAVERDRGGNKRGSNVRFSAAMPSVGSSNTLTNKPFLHPPTVSHPGSTTGNSPIDPLTNLFLNEEEIFEAVSAVRLRDLRRLDTVSNPNEEKSILIRRHAVIFAMDPIRAVVMAKRIILIVPDGADSLIGILDGFMKEWVENYHRLKREEEEAIQAQIKQVKEGGLPLLPTKPSLHRAHSSNPDLLTRIRKNSNNSDITLLIPFEIHAYEALLMTVKELETQEFTFIHDQIQNALLYFKDAALVPIQIQSQIRQLKNDLSIMMSRVQGSRQALQEITEDDEDMALMNLSLLKKKPKLYRYPLIPEILSKHDEIEELIESYLMDFASLESKIDYVRSQIQSSEELVSLRLDTSRNELLIANTALAILSCAIAFGAYLTGVFGMNLDQTIYLQPRHGSFAYVTAGSFVLMLIVFIVIYGYLRLTDVLPGKPNFAQSPSSSSSGSKRW